MISIDKLNENQLKAVNHLDGPCMVLSLIHISSDSEGVLAFLEEKGHPALSMECVM